MSESKTTEKKKSLVGVVVHSFFIIPFLIAVISVIVFALVQLMIREDHDVMDYLNDIKVGGVTKRWQAAFELSKRLADIQQIPEDERFTSEFITIFQKAEHDDVRIRQYLALAMGRTGNPLFVEPLLQALSKGKESELPSIVYALGLLRDVRALPVLHQLLLDPDRPLLRNRSAIALGLIKNQQSIEPLSKVLNDIEPNVRWNAALSLAKLGDLSGKSILLALLDRDYYSSFPEVDVYEQDQAILVAIEALVGIDDPDLNHAIHALSTTDKNIKIRQAALNLMDSLRSNTAPISRQLE